MLSDFPRLDSKSVVLLMRTDEILLVDPSLHTLAPNNARYPYTSLFFLLMAMGPTASTCY